MADTESQLRIRILLEDAAAQRGLRNLGGESESTGAKMAKMAVAAASFAAVTAFIKTALDAASKLQQSMGGVEAVFKDSAGSIKDWGKDADRTLGLSQSAYQDLATLIGSQLKNAGTSMDELGPKTNALITQGADLAAMYGGTTADAVSALSSALKGEMDPMERYGTSLNDHAIKTKILELGLDDSTAAAEKAARTTATLALITQQTADATGAAGREIGSYASVQQQMSASWENMMATVGTALLPVMSQLGQTFTDLIPTVTAVLTPIAELLAAVIGMPGPVWAMIGAFGVAVVIGHIVIWLQGLTAAMTGATVAARVLSLVMKTFGGPWVVAIGLLVAAAAGIAAWVSSSGTAEIATNDLSDAVDANTGKLKENAAALIVGKVAETESAYQALGGKIGDVTAALAGNKEAQDRVNATFREAGIAALAATGQYSQLHEGTDGLTESAAEAYDRISAQSGALAEMGGVVGQVGAGLDAYQTNIGSVTHAQELGTQAALNGAAAEETLAAAVVPVVKAWADLSEEEQAAAVKAQEAAVASTAVATTLDTVSASASAASTAIDFYVVSMQAASGNNASLDQAARLMNSTLRDSAAAFKGAADDGGFSMDALTSWNVAALTTTERGEAIAAAMEKQQTSFATSTTAAYFAKDAVTGLAGGIDAARAAADTQYGSFIEMATAATGSADAAAALAAKLGIVQGVAIDPKTFTLIAEDQAAKDKLALMKGEKIPDIPVVITTDVKPVADDISDVATADYPAVVDVTAPQTRPVQSQIGDVADGPYSATVTVAMNATAFYAALTPVLTMRELWVQVVAKTASFDQTMQDITNRAYTATVSVAANTAPARAAISSIPGAAPAGFAAPEQMRSFMAAFAPESVVVPFHAAPELSLTGAGLASGDTYNITVTGALDPDAVARQIDRLLTARSRRSGSVTI